jgi:hypothetical protein
VKVEVARRESFVVPQLLGSFRLGVTRSKDEHGGHPGRDPGKDEGLESSRGNRRNRVKPERRGDGEERRADYKEPQRDLLQKAMHAGDDRQKGRGGGRRAAGGF